MPILDKEPEAQARSEPVGSRSRPKVGKAVSEGVPTVPAHGMTPEPSPPPFRDTDARVLQLETTQATQYEEIYSRLLVLEEFRNTEVEEWKIHKKTSPEGDG